MTETNNQLASIVARIEAREEDKRAITDDIKDIYAEAKGSGFDVQTIRKVVALRRQDRSKREEAAALLDTYLRELGMLPLFTGGE